MYLRQILHKMVDELRDDQLRRVYLLLYRLTH